MLCVPSDVLPWSRQHIVVHSVWEESSRQACRKVEEHYEKLLELHGLAAKSPIAD